MQGFASDLIDRTKKIAPPLRKSLKCRVFCGYNRGHHAGHPWRPGQLTIEGNVIMAKSHIQMTADKREGSGKGTARAVRRSNRVPAVIYGDNKQPVLISLEENR